MFSRTRILKVSRKNISCDGITLESTTHFCVSFEGQEDLEEEYEQDGETKITPFNMKDEMEEGYFDGQGTYIWNKRDGSEVKDNWLDSVDWMKVREERILKYGFV